MAQQHADLDRLNAGLALPGLQALLRPETGRHKSFFFLFLTDNDVED